MKLIAVFAAQKPRSSDATFSRTAGRTIGSTANGKPPRASRCGAFVTGGVPVRRHRNATCL